MGDGDSFSLPEMNHELEKFWIALKEEEKKTEQFSTRITTLSTLNTFCIIVIAVLLMTLIAINRKEFIRDHDSP